jgi:LacI family transcriptional regulator
MLVVRSISGVVRTFYLVYHSNKMEVEVNNGRRPATQKATMRDVARRAEVSLATVSYVLNPGTRPVSEVRRQRVQAAIEELGYKAAPRPRLPTRTLIIGLIVPDASNPFFSRSLHGVERVLRRAGHLILCSSSGEDPPRERTLLTGLLRRKIDGLILTPCGQVPPQVEQLVAGGFPVVIMDRAGLTQLNRVVMNNYESAFQATRLLVESGHERIALVNGPEHIDTARERKRGYRAALEFAGLPCRPEYELMGAFSFEHGQQATRRLLTMAGRPTAIFSSSAILTSGVLWAVRERRLRWPEDIAIVGFGDAVWATLVSPPLTVIQQPVEQLGETAAQLVLAAIDHDAPASGQRVVLDSHLILRESHWGPERSGGRRRQQAAT